MSSSNCCFSTCVQISQKAGQVVCYSHLLRNFPVSCDPHSQRLYSIVNKAEVDVFLELSCLFYDPTDVAIWSLVRLPFLNPAGTSGSSQFMYSWSLAWRIFECNFASLGDECNCAVVWTFFGIAFLWDSNENWPFPVLWPLLSFPNFLAYWSDIMANKISAFWNLLAFSLQVNFYNYLCVFEKQLLLIYNVSLCKLWKLWYIIWRIL